MPSWIRSLRRPGRPSTGSATCSGTAQPFPLLWACEGVLAFTRGQIPPRSKPDGGQGLLLAFCAVSGPTVQGRKAAGCMFTAVAYPPPSSLTLLPSSPHYPFSPIPSAPPPILPLIIPLFSPPSPPPHLFPPSPNTGAPGVRKKALHLSSICLPPAVSP